MGLNALLWNTSKEYKDYSASALQEVKEYLKHHKQGLNVPRRAKRVHDDGCDDGCGSTTSSVKSDNIDVMLTTSSVKTDNIDVMLEEYQKDKNDCKTNEGASNEIISEAMVPESYVYKIRFKRNLRPFKLYRDISSSILQLRVGNLVLVRADRGGNDAGVIQSIEPIRLRKMVADYDQQSILRKATAEEVTEFRIKENDERAVQQKIEEIVTATSLPMTILDVEYQFDRRKLTVFYEEAKNMAEGHIPKTDDVSNLSRTIVTLLKTRVWMKKIGRDDHDQLLPPIDLSLLQSDDYESAFKTITHASLEDPLVPTLELRRIVAL